MRPCKPTGTHRLARYKLHASASQQRDLTKAEKDLLQPGTLIAILTERDGVRSTGSMAEVPDEVFQTAQSQVPALRRLLSADPKALDAVEQALAGKA